MSTFFLKVLTPTEVCFADWVERVILRTTEGEIGILPHHMPYAAALSAGRVRIKQAGAERLASITGGMLVVDETETSILTDTFAWLTEE